MRRSTKQPQFYRTRLELSPLAERIHDLDLNSIREVKAVPREEVPRELFRGQMSLNSLNSLIQQSYEWERRARIQARTIVSKDHAS